MRSLALILLLATCGVLHAQVQERKLVDRLLKPDMTLGNPMQNKAFNGASGGGLDVSKDANVKEFYFIQKFTPKTFDTKQFEVKNYWQGDFQFATKSATVKTDFTADKTFETKGAPVKEAREAGKSYQTATTRAYATRVAPELAKTSQNHLDEVYKGKTEMNIDEVRDLLNKPKL